MTRVYKQNVSGRVTLLPETNLWPVWPVMPVFNETSRKKKRENVFQKHSHAFTYSRCFRPGFWETCFHCQSLFPRCKLCFRYTAENFNENPSIRVARKKFASTSEYTSNICEQFEQRPNFPSASVEIEQDHFTLLIVLPNQFEMFRLALSSHIYFLHLHFESLPPKHVLWQRLFRGTSEYKVRNFI